MDPLQNSFPSASRPPALTQLLDLPLTAENQRRYELALQSGLGGSAPFRRRKAAELHEFLVLAQLSGRIRPLGVNLDDELQLHFFLRCPVPTLLPGGTLRVLDEAEIVLRYREEAMRLPQPGTSFVTLLQPQGICHPNVSVPDPARGLPHQVLCIGANVPAGIPVRELVLLTYGALALQLIEMDALAAAGILNHEAAVFWQHNLSQIPLSEDPFVMAPT